VTDRWGSWGAIKSNNTSLDHASHFNPPKNMKHRSGVVTGFLETSRERKTEIPAAGSWVAWRWLVISL
jgi:hypothetical protein